MSLDPKILQRARQFVNAIPHCTALSMELTDVSAGRASMTMPYDPRLVGDPQSGVIHGGAVSTLMDTCCGAAVMSHPEGRSATATIDLRIDHMRPARPGQNLTATATCYHVTRTVAFVRAVAIDNDVENPVATATGAFTFDKGTP